MEKLIEVKNLKTFFYTEAGVAKAVNNISFDILKGEVLGIVGESGSGKSVTSLSINRLIPDPPGKIEAFSIQIQSFVVTSICWITWFNFWSHVSIMFFT